MKTLVPMDVCKSLQAPYLHENVERVPRITAWRLLGLVLGTIGAIGRECVQ